MNDYRILVVDDEEDLCEILKFNLENEGYEVDTANSAEEAMKMDISSYHLILLDVMMGEISGFKMANILKKDKKTAKVPIIFITAKDTENDTVTGFNLGADDYLVKPINYDELNLRIKALLRRSKIANDKKIVIGNTTLDYDALTVTQNGNETLLPQKEFYLLYKLLCYPNKIFTRQQLMDEIWGFDNESDEKTVNVHINRLREKFKSNMDFEIVTIRGLGYKAVKKNG